ncbi:hypothetical protein HUA74_08055 [Myxococcus sp. CA051A]|uniref:Lipoprotein n=1 Tax=Myxococcus llanfairpwllgwyngyllgogerychwyrndrobwllllantysiliogogogochensis TaxID=2590453 RepID=A0A540X6T1_9BACT|nr:MULTISPECIES: hypothetical protein [Myxococcus]NTX02922.1 hypothetical protein [Myxococcus sp. CA040A]NTX11338.1 hypothetical protein [Myxococcus sp. CA056]NTX34562.1 hypothetical protein [Myxococcus sp. CA033]NTX54222.1 hypothetical protein [Myxococcus sp. CA039A]NTX60610.1 hypothetical protein [Myxococcus sp. CA051A]
MSSFSVRHTLSGVLAATLLLSTPALADWVGDLRVKSAPLPGQKGAPPETKGKMYGRPGMMRMDLAPAEVPGGMSIIFDWDKRTGTTLFHSRKAATSRSLDDMSVKIPGTCVGKDQDFDACFKEQGFKKVGTEKVNGHPTVVYEGVPPGAEGSIQRQKVWRPTDLPEVAYVRSQTFDKQGKVQADIDVTNIQMGAQPASLFAVPAGYQELDAASAAPPIMGSFKPEDLQGKTPEQIQEMIRQRMQQGPPPAKKK